MTVIAAESEGACMERSRVTVAGRPGRLAIVAGASAVAVLVGGIAAWEAEVLDISPEDEAFVAIWGGLALAPCLVWWRARSRLVRADAVALAASVFAFALLVTAIGVLPNAGGPQMDACGMSEAGWSARPWSAALVAVGAVGGTVAALRAVWLDVRRPEPGNRRRGWIRYPIAAVVTLVLALTVVMLTLVLTPTAGC